VQRDAANGGAGREEAWRTEKAAINRLLARQTGSGKFRRSEDG
jgi:hypothetical protein